MAEGEREVVVVVLSLDPRFSRATHLSACVRLSPIRAFPLAPAAPLYMDLRFLQPGCFWDEGTCKGAGICSSADAHENGCPCGEWTCREAAENGAPKLLTDTSVLVVPVGVGSPPHKIKPLIVGPFLVLKSNTAYRIEIPHNCEAHDVIAVKFQKFFTSREPR